jgi:hypothetical protein
MDVPKSSLFYTGQHAEIADKIRQFLNSQVGLFTPSTANSPRAVGDAMQDILAENFQAIVGKEVCAVYSSDFARRAMADLAFEDRDGFYYVVDVKTHRLSTRFNMPNPTSVERLARFYENDKNYFVILLIAYDIAGIQAHVESVRFMPIEFLGWDCLTIGALGWGQIQIANANVITLNEGYSRRKWMIELCDLLLDFYPKEIAKVTARIEHFRSIKARWESRPE